MKLYIPGHYNLRKPKLLNFVIHDNTLKSRRIDDLVLDLAIFFILLRLGATNKNNVFKKFYN